MYKIKYAPFFNRTINNTKNNNYMTIGEQQSRLAILYIYNIHHAKYPFSTTIRYLKIAEIITYTTVPVVEYLDSMHEA